MIIIIIIIRLKIEEFSGRTYNNNKNSQSSQFNLSLVLQNI